MKGFCVIVLMEMSNFVHPNDGRLAGCAWIIIWKRIKILEKDYKEKRKMTTDERFMAMALDEARAAMAQDEIPVGAVVVAPDGRVIGKGHNLTETLRDVTAHAEMQAITAAAGEQGGKYLTGCTLYVTVEPCVMCAGAIAWSQLGRLVFGASDEKRGYCKYAPEALHPKTVVERGVMGEECAQLMKDFFKDKRK